jgi:hypothetical protein
VLTVCILFTTASHAENVDWIFMTQRSFSSAQLKSLGDAGVALSGDISAGMHNPALVYASLKELKGVVSVGYGRDSLFSRHILPVSFGIITRQGGGVGGFYRYQSGNGGIRQHEVALNLSGLMFANADVQGEVDFGINIRYEWMDFFGRIPDVLSVERHIIDSTVKTPRVTTLSSVDTSYRGTIDDRRMIVDIGFYQPGFMEHFDFGLTMRNLLGYHWKKEKPYQTTRDSSGADTVIQGDTLESVIRTDSYINKERKSKGWLYGGYRTLLIGIVYHADISKSFRLLFPVDMEILGLFKRNIDTKFAFRGGVAGCINDFFILRFGYARQPKTILEGITSFKNAHFFTGGAGVYIAPVSIDCYFSFGAFGLTAAYRF